MVSREQSAAQRAAVTDAQVGVLGSLLIDPATVPVLMRQLQPQDFPDSTYRHIFEAARAVFLEGTPVDPVTVLDRLGKAYGPALRELMALTPTAANCELYARILREDRMLSEIQAACRPAVFADAYADAYTALAKAAALLMGGGTTREADYGELARDYVLRQRDRSSPDFLDLGIPEVTAQVHISPGLYVVLGADSSVGKTALALQIARSIAKTGKRVGFFSYETGLEDVADRLMSNAADVKLAESKTKTLPAAAMARAEAEAANMGALPLKVMETADFTVDDILAKTMADQFRVIVIDYVQLIPTDYRDAKDAVSHVSKALRRMAQRLGVTVIALSQVTLPDRDKDGGRRYITKEDLRESKQLKIDANIILLLDMWDTKSQFGDRILIVGKSKDGALGKFRLKFEPEYMRFSYRSPEDEKPKKKKGKGDVYGQQSFEDDESDDKDLPF